jgi:E3 ubiquitin-protein ligase BRE1
MQLVEYEDKLARLQAEKAKAEQKYFSTMKSKDQMQNENRTLKQQLAKTAEVITKVQDAEKSLVLKMVLPFMYRLTSKESLERQLALVENTRNTLEKKLSESLKKESESRILLESANSQILEVQFARSLLLTVS